MAEFLVGIVGRPAAAPDPVAADPNAPCPHPAAARVALGSLAAPGRTFCQQCQTFL